MMLQLIEYVQSRLNREDGATMVEYGIMIALIAVISIGIIAVLGGQVFDAFTGVSNSMP